MRLRKVCPQCNTVVHLKRSVCDCGHAFPSKKRKARCTAVGEPENAMKALLSEEELLVHENRRIRKNGTGHFVPYNDRRTKTEHKLYFDCYCISF